MACGIAWFSLASLLLPAALSAPVSLRLAHLSNLLSTRTLLHSLHVASVRTQVARTGLTMAAVLLARACVGLGEGVALPTMNHLVAAHVPPASRATALGTAFSGFHCGAHAGLCCRCALFGARTLIKSLRARQLAGPGGVAVAAGCAGLALAVLHIRRGGGAAAGSVAGCRACPGDSLRVGRVGAMQHAGPAGELCHVGYHCERSHHGHMHACLCCAKHVYSQTCALPLQVVNVVNHWGYFIYLSWMPSYFHQVAQALHAPPSTCRL